MPQPSCKCCLTGATGLYWRQPHPPCTHTLAHFGIPGLLVKGTWPRCLWCKQKTVQSEGLRQARRLISHGLPTHASRADNECRCLSYCSYGCACCPGAAHDILAQRPSLKLLPPRQSSNSEPSDHSYSAAAKQQPETQRSALGHTCTACCRRPSCLQWPPQRC